MKSPNNNARRHSEEYFGDDRDFYWNRDFLDLIGKRLGLGEISYVADIGCGIGHWSELLYPLLTPAAKLVGVDLEPEHLTHYQERMKNRASCSSDIETRQADATSLPLPTDHFELTTCQTLLLHLPDALAALREMVRVTKPGGLILCAEPNNIVARLPFAGLQSTGDLDQLLRLSELAWRHAIGREKRGLGSEFVGEQLPGMFRSSGLIDIQVWLSDKASAFIPPYRTPGEMSVLRTSDQWRADASGPFDRDAMRKNVIASGGTESFFNQAWIDYLDIEQRSAVARDELKWHTAGGVLFYVVAGRKPKTTAADKEKPWDDSDRAGL